MLLQRYLACVLAITVLLTCTVGGPHVAYSATATTRYSSVADGYSLTYPAKWEHDDTPSTQGGVLLTGITLRSIPDQAVIFLAVSHFASTPTKQGQLLGLALLQYGMVASTLHISGAQRDGLVFLIATALGRAKGLPALWLAGMITSTRGRTFLLYSFVIQKSKKGVVNPRAKQAEGEVLSVMRSLTIKP